MLKVFRRKGVTKFVLWLLLILIMPAFVLWGTEALTRAKRTGPAFVGSINGRKVSFDDLAASMAALRCQVILNNWNKPEAASAILNDKPLMARGAWERLIVLGEAKKKRVTAGDREVSAYIMAHPFFSRGGRFDSRLYEYFLRHSLGLAPRSFEEEVRENLEITKARQDVVKDVRVTDEEVEAECARREIAPGVEDYEAKKAGVRQGILYEKESGLLAPWFDGLAARTTLNIDFKEIDEYYGKPAEEAPEAPEDTE